MSDKKNTPAVPEDMEKQIEKWKKEHGDVYRIKATNPSDEKTVYTCYVKKPSKAHIAAAAPFMQSDTLKAGEVLRSNNYLGGDPEILSIPEVEIAVNLRMFELFKIASTELEKL